MADHTLNAVRAAARAMEEVVLSALDPRHPLANEQARLVLKYLSLIERWWPYGRDRNRFELDQYIQLAGEVLKDAVLLSPSIADALEKAAVDGRSALDGESADQLSEIQRYSRRLAGVISALARTAADASPEVRQRIHDAILARSKNILDLQRSWFLPQGWERDAANVPPLDKLFRLKLRLSDLD